MSALFWTVIIMGGVLLGLGGFVSHFGSMF
jgi:hypothetical protein